MKMGFPYSILRKYMIVPSIQINQCVYNELHFCKKKLTCCICLYLPPTHEGENSANIEIIGVGRLKHSLTSSLGNEPACLRSQAGVAREFKYLCSLLYTLKQAELIPYAQYFVYLHFYNTKFEVRYFFNNWTLRLNSTL
jgi:hypothetical protein